MKHPDTINYPDTFDKAKPAGFDGVFDWSWTQGCFGAGNITPMDIDGMVERKGNFIVFETKGINVPVPPGQLYTLESLYRLNVFTIVFVAGKERPEALKVWHAKGFRGQKKMSEFVDCSIGQCRAFVSKWYEFADSK